MTGKTNAQAGGGESIPETYGLLIKNNTGENMTCCYMEPENGQTVIYLNGASTAEITVQRGRIILFELAKRGGANFYLPDESYPAATYFYSETSHLYFYGILTDEIYEYGGWIDAV